jgi:hypothetical protein
MDLPIAICEPTSSMRSNGWVILILVAAVYLGLLAIAVRGAAPGARLRVAATWLLSAAGVTILVWSLEQNTEAGDGTIILAAAGIVAVVTLIGIGLRKTERAWPYVMAGSIGGITPIALLVALVAWIYASGGCLD